MPDKRQESKQRRAARNRANREALAARRENAVTQASSPPSRPAASKPSSSSSKSSPSATAGGGAAVPAPPPSGLLGLLRSKRPGDKAVLVAAVLAILGALAMLFLFKVSVDDRGEPLPAPYGGLTVAAREALTGDAVPDRKMTLLDAYGSAVAIYALIPLGVVGFALWGVRRPDRSRMLTFAMLAMAGVVVLGSLVYFFPALIALLVAGFQVRRADLPARAAKPVGGRGRPDGDVIDTTATEGGAEAAGDEAVDADTVDAERAGDEAAGDEAGEGTAGAEAGAATEAPPDDAEPDPLAELEAEIEAERAAEGGEPRPDDGGGPGTTGR